MGVIDRILRFVGIHLIISLADAAIIDHSLGLSMLTMMGLYLVITVIIGIDPIYKLTNINTVEIKTNDNLKA